MNSFIRITPLIAILNFTALAADPTPAVPRFSVDYMDRSVDPGQDFFRYADGNWLKNNPVPADKSRWTSFGELQERNLALIHQILDDAAADTGTPPKSIKRMAGDFFASAMDTDHIETIGIEPIADDLKRIEQIQSSHDLFTVLADFHKRGIGGIFTVGISPDEKNSSVYALELNQSGLGLPDRDYYLKDGFAAQREAYRAHVGRMFVLLGETADDAAAHAGNLLDLETALAKASRTRVELRDPNKNYNKFTLSELTAKNPAIQWNLFFSEYGVADPPYVVVGQPEFFEAAGRLLAERPLSDWKIYLRWILLHSSATYLQKAIEQEDFAFFGKTLSGQQEMEPRWKRVARIIDRSIGEALGQLYVEKYFPPEARARMLDLVINLKIVFRDHLQSVDWMTEATRAKALSKFDRFVQKIGYPDKFRDYSSVEIRRDDFLGNVRRAGAFEVHRRAVRLGQTVDKTEWTMTPPTVNAYFNPVMNEIVFPAGILQPSFFDAAMDDAVNYGAIGVVIGHEITHGYDDEGRHFDADGNLVEWWTSTDARAFEERAQKVVDEYDAFEPLPGVHVNGKLTLGENIADLGGVTIAYDALERLLAKDPSKRKTIDGLTPEQRFFISYAQIWRTTVRDAESRRLVTVDPHSPGQFRSIGPLVNFPPFYEAFNIKPGQPMWRPPEQRAKIW